MSMPYPRSRPVRPTVPSPIVRVHGRKRSRQSFTPKLLALETRALLSTLTVTNDHDSGAGSLRAQLAAAHAGDTIGFAPSAYGTIDLTSGPLQVATGVDITGPGATKVAVSGDDLSDVFDVPKGVAATISGLTVTGGVYSVADGHGAGGIINDGTLTLSGDVVSGNAVAPVSYGGGGITNDGTLTISGTTISGNTGLSGGGIYNDGPLTITDSTLSGNTAREDGGGLDSFADVSLTRCVVSGNTLGGIDIFAGYDDSASTLSVTDCSIVGNTNDQVEQALGAGISDIDSVVMVTDSTIVDNTAKAPVALGAGIYVGMSISPYVSSTSSAGINAATNISPTSVPGLTIIGSTLSGNRTIGTGLSGFAYGGAIHTDPFATLSVSDSSFLDNTAAATVQAQGGAMDLGDLKPSTITACQFSGNQAVVTAGGLPPGQSALGGAINIEPITPLGSTLTIADSTFTKNSVQGGPGGGSGLGGAILNYAQGVGSPSTLTLSSDLFLGNSATGGPAGTSGSGNVGGYGLGGALYNLLGATATVSDSTFVGNTATGGPASGAGNTGGPGEGGAVENFAATMTVSGSTFIGNAAVGGAGTNGATGGDGEGGGVDVSGSGANASFTDVLITLNAATGGAGGGKGYGGGLYIATGALTTLKNTLVVGNTASTAGNNIDGTLTTG
jgi:hypothetical protein